MLENASFVHVFGCMCMLELTITGWWIIVAYLSIPNWFELQLVSQLASYLFSYFLLRSLLPFSNSKFFLISCIYANVCMCARVCTLYAHLCMYLCTYVCCTYKWFSTIFLILTKAWVERFSFFKHNLSVAFRKEPCG